MAITVEHGGTEGQQSAPSTLLSLRDKTILAVGDVIKSDRWLAKNTDYLLFLEDLKERVAQALNLEPRVTDSHTLHQGTSLLKFFLDRGLDQAEILNQLELYRGDLLLEYKGPSTQPSLQ